jgi:hypothetical protein
MINESENELKFLTELSSKKSELENHLKKLDKCIYDAETKYLENTQSCGNIIKGWDQFFSTKSKIGGMPKKTKFSFNERLFSQSSFNNTQLKEDGIINLNGIKHLNSSHTLNSSMRSSHQHQHQSNGTHKKKIMSSSLSLKKKKLNGGIVNGRSLINHNNNHNDSQIN